MARDPAARPSAAQLLQHEWIVKYYQAELESNERAVTGCQGPGEEVLEKMSAAGVAIYVDTTAPLTPASSSKPRISGTKHAHDDIDEAVAALTMIQLGTGDAPPRKMPRSSWLQPSASEDRREAMGSSIDLVGLDMDQNQGKGDVLVGASSCSGEMLPVGHIDRLKSRLRVAARGGTWLKKFSIRRGGSSSASNVSAASGESDDS